LIPYKPPTYEERAFNCPHCGVYSTQDWSKFHVSVRSYSTTPSPPVGRIGGQKTPPKKKENDVKVESSPSKEVKFAVCLNCKEYSIWHKERMLYPSGSAPLPHPDLPNDIKDDYEEARAIASHSPRGAAALLRLAIQKLCKHLGEKGENINKDIASLVEKGLSPKIQKALDIVRVIGNEAAHPGQLDLKDDVETAKRLFELINLIVEEMITRPKQVNELYESLPESKRKAIEERDARKNH
jgi:hypothetical protein